MRIRGLKHQPGFNTLADNRQGLRLGNAAPQALLFYTHWAFAEEFKKRYPQIKLKPERLITDEGSLFCSGGYSAGLDLSLYLVEKYCGYEVALQLNDCWKMAPTPLL
ncbi:putative transcriptional regulator, AraC type [Desulfosarcina variabilis str. Montpellier]